MTLPDLETLHYAQQGRWEWAVKLARETGANEKARKREEQPPCGRNLL